MNNDLTITALEQDDWRALHALCTHPDVAYWTDHHPLETPESFQQKLERAAPHTQHFYLAARHRGRLVGFVWLALGARLRNRRSAQLTMAVHPDFQRRGVGQLLVEEVISISDRWLDLLRLSVSLPSDHTVGLALFQKRGFVIEAEHRAELLRSGEYINTTQLARIRPGFTQDPALILLPPESIAKPREDHAVQIRAMTPEDIDEISDSFQEPSAYWGTLQLPYPPRTLWRKRLTTFDEPRHMFVAETKGKVVGNLALHGFTNPRRSHSWHLGIGVHAHYQGAGIGQQLMSAAMKFADEWLGAKRVELTVYVDNTRAVKLYERQGFVIEGRYQADSFRDGAYVDVYVMGRLRP